MREKKKNEKDKSAEMQEQKENERRSSQFPLQQIYVQLQSYLLFYGYKRKFTPFYCPSFFL